MYCLIILLIDDSLYRNMNPLVVALLRRMPVIGDMITAFEGRGNKGQPNRGKAKLGRSQKRYNPEF